MSVPFILLKWHNVPVPWVYKVIILHWDKKVTFCFSWLSQKILHFQKFPFPHIHAQSLIPLYKPVNNCFQCLTISFYNGGLTMFMKFILEQENRHQKCRNLKKQSHDDMIDLDVSAWTWRNWCLFHPVGMKRAWRIFAWNE